MKLVGGYGVLQDSIPALKRLRSDRARAIDELWESLYHEGVGIASYAAVPKLVEEGELSLVAAIEVARNEPHTPPIPYPFYSRYFSALEAALKISPRDEEQYQGYYVIHASLNGQIRLAKALNFLSVEEFHGDCD